MKKVCLTLMMMAALANVSLAGWSSYVIRNASAVPYNSPVINDLGSGQTQFLITEGGMKAGLGTNDIAGSKVGDILSVSIDRISINPTTSYAPYMNIWVTNGSGKYAVIANEPSDGVWGGNAWKNITWDTLKTKVVKVYETNDKSWLPNSGVGLTFADVASLTMMAPTSVQLGIGWAGLGTGAPREFGTNNAYAFNWVFGDTLQNYVSGQDGFIVANPKVAIPVPAPGALILGSLGAGFIGWIRRRSN